VTDGSGGGRWHYRSTSAHNLGQGRPIYTLDGYKIGSVAELSGTHMRVHTSHTSQAADYWLPTHVIQFTSIVCVIVHFRNHDLSRYKLAELPAA